MKAFVGFGFFVLSILACIGWWKNLIGVIALGNAGPITAMFALKLVGVFAFPLGVILGWFY